MQQNKKMSIAKRGHAPTCFGHSEETKRKISESKSGMVFTDSHKQKLRESARLRKHEKTHYHPKPLSEEAKRRIGESSRKRLTGGKLSEETKRKISESMKKRKQLQMQNVV